MSEVREEGFVKYHHVERFGQSNVRDIEVGECYVYSKLDGTNASIWMEDGVLKGGSRNRVLKVGKEDNAGFYEWVLTQLPLFQPLFEEHPGWHLHGEWLVPHTLKTYRPEAWRRFWVFDVYSREDHRLLHWDSYGEELAAKGVDVVRPLCTMVDGNEESFQKVVNENTFLIQDGKGVGEGIVIKNYNWRNQWGHQVWAKIVRNEFREDNRAAFGVNKHTGVKLIEAAIAETYVTKAFVDKTRAKIELETTDRKILIPRLLQTCYHDVVQEEIWDIVKKGKNPTIDFRKLQAQVIYKVKQYADDLF
jgi:hypothetical protein